VWEEVASVTICGVDDVARADGPAGCVDGPSGASMIDLGGRCAGVECQFRAAKGGGEVEEFGDEFYRPQVAGGDMNGGVVDAV